MNEFIDAYRGAYGVEPICAPLGYVPPAECEQAYPDRQAALGDVAVLT